MENIYKSTDWNQLLDIMLDIRESEKSGKRCESLVPYATQIFKNLNPDPENPAIALRECLAIAKANFSDALFDRILGKYEVSDCPICGKKFVKTDNRFNFCQQCSQDKKAIKRYNDQKRKRNTIQIEHKAIVDMLRNRNEDYNDFVNESYYYKDLIEGKKVQACPNGYDSSIQTKKQYEEWLKKKHKELTKRPKSHKIKLTGTP